MSTTQRKRHRRSVVFWEARKRIKLMIPIAGGASEAEEREHGESAHDEVIDLTHESSDPVVADLTHNASPETVQENRPQRRRLITIEIDLRLPVIHTEDEPRNNSVPSDTVSCPICMDGYSEILQSERLIVSTLCGHIFCSQCLPQALQKDHFCPTCREQLNDIDYHPIYL